MAKLLLARNDVNPNESDQDDETPLWRASSNGRAGVVELLLARNDVNPYKQDNHGRTPLHIATIHRHEMVIALLQPLAFLTLRISPKK